MTSSFITSMPDEVCKCSVGMARSDGSFRSWVNLVYDDDDNDIHSKFIVVFFRRANYQAPFR